MEHYVYKKIIETNTTTKSVNAVYMTSKVSKLWNFFIKDGLHNQFFLANLEQLQEY